MLETRNPNVILVSVTYVQNKEETLNEIKELKKINKKINAKLFIAGASIDIIEDSLLKEFTLINSMKDVEEIAKNEKGISA